VVARVHHDALGAHAGAGHHRRRYPCPYVRHILRVNIFLRKLYVI
jgi:hypothetical protein